MMECAKCKECGVDRLDRADWDEYDGLCPSCSYAQHRRTDDAEFRATLTRCAAICRRLEGFEAGEVDHLIVSTLRSASEAVVAAWDMTTADTLTADVDHAAGMACRLALLLLGGAPQVVIEHHMRMLGNAVRRRTA